jgi:acetyl esterase/lipase
MTRKADISPQAKAIVAEMRAAGLTVPSLETLHQYRADTRAGYAPTVERALAGFDGEISEIEIAGVRCKQVTPPGWSQQDGPCIQYAYGGGYVGGSTYEDLAVAIPLALHSKARIVMVDYRLSPEHPYPEPQQDMQRVYPVLLDVYGAARMVISGESAGGNQALALLHHIRDNGMMTPACAALLSPWCDLTNQGDSHRFNDGRDPSLSNEWVDLAASWHANGQALDDPGISPLNGDMAGLPPTIITTGSRDLLLSQCLRLAQRLRAAGVDCDLRVWEGLWHVFEFYPIPEAGLSIGEIAEFIETHCSAAISRLTR